jgi:hypothetical protein
MGVRGNGVCIKGWNTYGLLAAMREGRATGIIMSHCQGIVILLKITEIIFIDIFP